MIRFFLVILSIFFLYQNAIASEFAVVSAEWLKQHLNTPKLIILDASDTSSYLKGHIPGAYSASFSEEESVSHGINVSYGGGIDFTSDTSCAVPFQDRPALEMQEVYRSWGIDQDSLVVVYDAGGTNRATRLLHGLKYWGFDNVVFLDGGRFQWQRIGGKLVREVSSPDRKGSMIVKSPRRELRADLEEIFHASGNPDEYVIIDALGNPNHYGYKPFYTVAGHIPFAKCIPSSLYFNADKTLKKKEELLKIFHFFGVTPDKQIYTQCGGGVGASLPFFILKYVLEYPNVALYQGSFGEWLHDERGLPIWHYDEPFRLRSSAWLEHWAGVRNRTLGIVHTAVIDIRSTEDFEKEHLPFSISLPYAEMVKYLNKPDQLAEILGRSGLRREQEAVIFGLGVSKESALALWMLEYIGQRAVSIAQDDMEAWKRKGGTVTREKTPLGERKGRFDVALSPVLYDIDRKREIAVGTDDIQAVFPRIVVFSGHDEPSHDVGVYKHVPSAGIVRKGALLPCPELYKKIIVDAMLPKLAQIVCVADDPADAALLWLALKMLGYPDARVFLPESISSLLEKEKSDE